MTHTSPKTLFKHRGVGDLQTNHFSVPENLARKHMELGIVPWTPSLPFILFLKPSSGPLWLVSLQGSVSTLFWEQRASLRVCKPVYFLQPFKVVHQVVLFLPKGRLSSALGFLLTSRFTGNWILDALRVLSKAKRCILGYQIFVTYHHPLAIGKIGKWL